MKKYDIKNMHKTAHDIGIKKTGKPGKFLSKKYIDIKTKYKWQCGKCNYIWKVTADSVKQGGWCPNCAGNRRLTIDEMHKTAHEVGLKKTGKPGKFLSKKYINVNTKYEWQCGKCNYIWESRADHVRRGAWCPNCAKNLQLSIDDMYKAAHDMGIKNTGKPGKFLSKEYINTDTKYEWQCGKCGYIWETTADHIRRGDSWCPRCSGKARHSITEMHKIAYDIGLEKTGYPGKFLSKISTSKKYIYVNMKYKWQCGACKNIWEARPTHVLRGHWCPNCMKGFNERICRCYFEAIFEKEFPTTTLNDVFLDKTILEKYQIEFGDYKIEKMHLDGYNRELKLAFEYNGLQHYEYNSFFHSTEKRFKKQQKRDQIKRKICKENGIILIEVPYTVDPDEMQNYIIKKYGRKTKKTLQNMQKFDYRLFFKNQTFLSNFLK